MGHTTSDLKRGDFPRQNLCHSLELAKRGRKLAMTKPVWVRHKAARMNNNEQATMTGILGFSARGKAKRSLPSSVSVLYQRPILDSEIFYLLKIHISN